MDGIKGYALYDSRKFDSLDDALKEIERVRAFIGRKRKSVNNVSKVTACVSEVDMQTSMGTYIYSDSKRKGGRRVFAGPFKSTVRPHIHWYIEGVGSSAMASYLINNFKEKYPQSAYSKKLLETWDDRSKWENYLKVQAIYMRKF